MANDHREFISGKKNGKTNELFFTAGPTAEDLAGNGLFGMIQAAGHHGDGKHEVADNAAVTLQKSTIVGLAPLPTATGPEITAEGWLIDMAPASGGVVATIFA